MVIIMKNRIVLLCAVVLNLLNLSVVQARNVDLSTVPDRDSVQLTIYNSEDLTLVKERRAVSFKQGNNPLQFSWANTLIDPSSVELRFVDHRAELELLDTTFAHDKPQMLYWNVDSSFSGEAVIEISYFTSGISWSADYTAIANQDESQLAMQGFVKIHNNSGEQYEQAQVRLVVGTINLVEQIAQLAGIEFEQVSRLREEKKQILKTRAARKMLTLNSPAVSADESVSPKPKAIIKQGLSEYFIYTIEGKETIPNGWSKRLRSFNAGTIPIEVKYRYRPQEYGDQLVRLFILTNDAASGLGETPLPDGQVRVFRDNGRDGMSFLARQRIQYIPVGDKLELNLGRDAEVIFELVKLNIYRDNIWMRLKGGKLYKRLGEHSFKYEPKSTVAGWDEHTVYAQKIRNYSNKSISVEVRRKYLGDINFRSRLNPTLYDFQTVQYTAQVKPGQKRELLHEVILRNGYNSAQSNVKLLPGKPVVH